MNQPSHPAVNRLTRFLKTSVQIAALALICVQPASAQTNAPGPNDAIFMYRGADRNQTLLEKARKEGVLMWYTSMAPTESRPLAAAFEKKYGIKVDLWRGPNEALIQRIMTEGKSKRHNFDVVETNGTEVEIIGREHLLSRIYTPFEADFPTAAVPPHHLWMPTRFNYLVTAYNTTKVKREDIPKSIEGFADPKWKNLVSIEAGDWDWMVAVQKKLGKEKGDAFFKSFAAMKPDMRKGHPLMAQLVGAGEIPVGLTVFLSNAISVKRNGSPLDWVPVEPVLAIPFGLGVAKHAPHPHAALLFADWILSPEGQEVLETLGRLPASTKIKQTAINFPFVPLDVGASIDESEKREKAWNGNFMNR
jgi:iron(III) transport system substrate-binding protein